MPPRETGWSFFVKTDQDHRIEGEDRSTIRRLVMEDYFDSKCAPERSKASELSAKATVKAREKLKCKFRLQVPGQEPRKKTKPRLRKNLTTEKGEKDEGKDVPQKRSKKSSKLADRPSCALPPNMSGKRAKKQTTTRRTSPEEVLKLEVIQKVTTLTRSNPNSHRFDPFDVLPVSSSPRLDILLKLSKQSNRINSLAVNAHRTWWRLASSDAGLLHAALATWALYGMLVRGMNDLAMDELRHKNEAIRHVNNRLSKCDANSDVLVATVVTLVNAENLCGAYDRAQVHSKGLKDMVDARGGLFAFGHNDGLMRGLIWVDFHTAAAFHTAPRYPRINSDPDSECLCDNFPQSAPLRQSMMCLSVYAVDWMAIFYRLQKLSICVSMPWFQRVNPLAFSRLLYETEYAILELHNCSKDFLDFDVGLRAPDETDESYQARSSFADGASVSEALLAASQIFICAALRDMPIKAKIFSLFLGRLRIALDRPNVSVIDTWQNQRNLEMLLWVLMVVCSVLPREERAWWIEKLEKVMEEVGVIDEMDLKLRLYGIAWTNMFFAGKVEDILRDVSVRTTPIVKTSPFEGLITWDLPIGLGQNNDRSDKGEASNDSPTTIDPALLDMKEGFQ